MERQQFIDNELENYIKQFPDATDAELDDILKSASTTFDSQNQPQITSTPMPEPQVQTDGMTNDIRQTLAPEVQPDLSLFQRFAGGPVGDVLAGIGNVARQSQTVSPEALAVVQQQTVIPTKEEALAQIVNNAQAGAQAIRNVPTAVGGLAAMIPSFATDIARGATDIMAGGAEMLGADQIGRRIREEGKLAADTAKQLAAESTANIRQFYEGKPTDVEGEMLAEELQPSKKAGALARAMTTKFLWDAENMPPDTFKAKYPEALPIDTFNAKFEEVLRNQSLPQTVKSFFFDMPLESVKTIYGAIAGDPEVRQRFAERPAETIVEIGVGLGIGVKGGKELYKATKDIARKATVFEKPQTQTEAAESFMQNERAMTGFLRRNTAERDQIRGVEQIRRGIETEPKALPDYSFEIKTPEDVARRMEEINRQKVDLDREAQMLEATGKGMTTEEQAATVQPPTPKPAVTIGEAERLQGEAIPEGRGGMTIGPRRPAVTFGGEGERTGEAIPEGASMTIQPTAPTNKLDQLFKREKKVEPKQIENRFDFSQETDINKLRSMLDDAVERENFQPGAESDAILKRIDELENQAIDQVSPELLNRIQESGVSPEASQKILEKAFLIKKNSIINNPKRMNDLLNEYSGIESAVKKTAKIILEDYVKQNFPKADVEGLFSNASPLSRDVQTKIIKDAQAKAKAIHGRVKDYFENPVEERMEQPSKTSPQPQQTPEVVGEDMKPQPVEQTPVKTPEIETQPQPKTGPGVFGGATMQNLYEEIAPKAKRGLDIFKKKAKEFIADEEGFYSPEELANAVKAVKDKFIGKIKRGQSTQVTNTINTYGKILDRIADKAQGKVNEVRIVDVSTGLGMSEELAKNLGYKKYETTEPFPAEGFIPTYKDSSQLPDNAFDFITNNQVLNVVPKEIRDSIVKDIGRALKEDGTAIISTRGKDVMAATTGRPGEEPMSLYIPAKDAQGKSYEQYQKGFTNAELKDYVQGLLGEGFEVKTAPFGAAGVEIVKKKKSTPKIGMLGAGTLQNLYEQNIEPTVKRGIDRLFGKRAKAYEQGKKTGIRTEEDLTKGLGLDITQDQTGKVTETEHRYQPRFIGGRPTQKGAINPSAIIDAISSAVGGKKKEKPFEVTIGDPMLAKEFEKTFKATQLAETTKKQTAKAREQSVMSAYKQGLVDLFSPIIDRVPKGQEREKVMSIVHDIFYLGSPAEAFMRKTKDIVLDKVKHEDYASYMAAKAITTFREHIEKPDRIKLAEDFLKSIDPKTIKEYEKITAEWHEKAWKPILEELKASGLGDPLIINNIMGNENYAPFFPAKQLGLPHGIGENAPGAGIYKLKGGMGDYMDVLAAKMKKGIAMMAAAKINQGKLATIDSMLKYDKANIKEAMPEYKGFYKERDPLTGKMLEIPIVEFPEPQPGSGLALMEARRDGKKVGYYVPKEITRAFDMAMGEGDTLGATMRGFQKMTQGFRNVWIEYNPIWQVAVNAPRDIMASVIEMPKIGNKFKFMGNLAKVAPAAVGDYVPVLGKIVQAFTGYDRKAFEKDVTKALGEGKIMSTREPQYLGETDLTVGEGLKRAYGLTEKHTGIAKALDTVQEFGKDIERMTKIAADLTLEGDKRFTDPEIKNIVRQIGSPAFPVRGGGDLFKTIKTATMFYNATKQSWVAAKYFLEKDPVGAIAFASMPMGLYAATIAAENGVFGDDMEKAYTLMKGYDKENKLNFPIGYKDNGEVEYISLPLPQFLKPVMRIMRTAAKENPKFLDSIIKGFSEELPMLNPVVGLINRITSYGDEKPPAAELSGQEIMTQDQWDAGGSIKGSAFLKAFWNDYLLGSQIRLKVKPSEREQTWQDRAIRFVFGKVYKTNFNEDLDTSATRQKQALQRLKTREAAEAKTPEEQQRLIKDMVKEGYTPQKGTFKSAKQQQVIETLRKTNAPAARQMEIYLSGKSKEEKVKAFQKLNDLLKKKKK